MLTTARPRARCSRTRRSQQPNLPPRLPAMPTFCHADLLPCRSSATTALRCSLWWWRKADLANRRAAARQFAKSPQTQCPHTLAMPPFCHAAFLPRRLYANPSRCGRGSKRRAHIADDTAESRPTARLPPRAHTLGDEPPCPDASLPCRTSATPTFESPTAPTGTCACPHTCACTCMFMHMHMHIFLIIYMYMSCTALERETEDHRLRARSHKDPRRNLF